jgi:FkbH-like protein
MAGAFEASGFATSSSHAAGPDSESGPDGGCAPERTIADLCGTLIEVKLSAALELLQSARSRQDPFCVTLACGFTPLHVQTFLAAHLQCALPNRRVEIKTGIYGDLAGTLERSAGSDAIAVAMEWADLDARLGYRGLGGWGPAEESDIVAQVHASLQRILAAIEKWNGTPVAISTPTLPLPPAFHTAGWEAGQNELELERAIADFAASAVKRPFTSLVNARRLLEDSPVDRRLDLKSEFSTGLPYTLTHADQVGQALARLIQRPAPKKGLITDLDDTLWKGIVGEVDAEGVSWDLASHSQLHGLYQQLLRALAASGVLIGVASKNDPAVVERAFSRRDLLLPKESVFPIEAHWEAKSKSAGRILKAWNISADSVVFVDDSPMELAEVKAAWPEMECLLFPGKDPANTEKLFRTLRDLFGKSHIGAEDALRLESLRRGDEFQSEAAQSGGAPESFLTQADATMTVEFNPLASDTRVLELVNKTNQFNLNGRRYTEADWRKERERGGAFVIAVSYQDKFGPLGKIAVLSGSHANGVVDVGAWVMSCRAFSRRIEDRCLEILFDKFGAGEIRFQFEPTPKNGPTLELFERYLDSKPAGAVSLSRARFEERAPLRYQRVELIEH